MYKTIHNKFSIKIKLRISNQVYLPHNNTHKFLNNTFRINKISRRIPHKIKLSLNLLQHKIQLKRRFRLNNQLLTAKNHNQKSSLSKERARFLKSAHL